MKNLNVKAFIWVTVVLSVLIWGIILYAMGEEFRMTWTTIGKLPSVVSIDLVLWSFFAKFGWKYCPEQLVPFPNLEGTWEGVIRSTWINPENGTSPGPISIILVIKQSFISISCVMHSQEMTSKSYTAEFLIDQESNSKKIAYSYTSVPNAIVRYRSTIHDGTALLNITVSSGRMLSGEYWTSRKTTGTIELKFRSKELLEHFPDSLI